MGMLGPGEEGSLVRKDQGLIETRGEELGARRKREVTMTFPSYKCALWPVFLGGPTQLRHSGKCFPYS